MTSIKKNYLMDLLYTLSGMVFPLLTYHYAAGILGKEGIGAVSFANGILAVFLMASQMGIPYYGIKAWLCVLSMLSVFLRFLGWLPTRCCFW